MPVKTNLSYVALAILATCMTGCFRVEVRSVDIDCTSGQQADIMCNNPALKVGTGDANAYGSLATLFDASLARVDTSASNVSLTSATGSATITLKRNGTTTAAAAFPYYRSGSYVYISNPSEVNAWVTANGAIADEVELSFDGFVFNRIDGLNTVVVEYQYASEVVSGAAWSRYYSPGGNDWPPHHQQ